VEKKFPDKCEMGNCIDEVISKADNENEWKDILS